MVKRRKLSEAGLASCSWPRECGVVLRRSLGKRRANEFAVSLTRRPRKVKSPVSKTEITPPAQYNGRPRLPLSGLPCQGQVPTDWLLEQPAEPDDSIRWRRSRAQPPHRPLKAARSRPEGATHCPAQRPADHDQTDLLSARRASLLPGRSQPREGRNANSQGRKPLVPTPIVIESRVSGGTNRLW